VNKNYVKKKKFSTELAKLEDDTVIVVSSEKRNISLVIFNAEGESFL
jgi:hypothetical protein